MIKKYFLIYSVAIVGVLLFCTTTVLGQDLTQQIASQSGYGEVDQFTLSQTVGRIIRVVLGLLGTIFLCLTLYAGFLWMTAAGNEEQAGKAIGILKTAVIGLVIILASYSITYFVLEKVFQATA